MTKADGWITIGTQLDNSKFDGQIQDLQRKADKKEVQIKITTSEIEDAQRRLEEYKKTSADLFNQYEQILAEQARFQELQSIGVGNLTSSQEKEYSGYLFRDFEDELRDIDKIMKDTLGGDLDTITSNLEKQKEKLKDQQYEYQRIVSKINEIKQKQSAENLKGINGQINKIGGSIQKVTKKVGKWALAVFGIRSAYMFIRQSMGVLAEHDEQLASDLEYIRYALASSVYPIVKFIVDLVYKLLILLGSIIKTLTGKNIFANANKGLDKAVGSAKDLKKQLAGFDEMNILSDSSDSGAGGSSVKPSFDLSDIDNADFTIIYSWIDKVKEIFNRGFDEIKKNIENVMLDLGFSEEYIAVWGFTVEGVRSVINGLLDFIKGILEIIVGLTTGDTEKVKEGVRLLGVGIVEILKGLVKTIIGVFGMILTGLYDVLIRPAETKITGFLNGIITKINNIISKINTKFSIMGSNAGNVFGGAFKSAINVALGAIEWILNKPITSINSLIKAVNKLPGVNMSTLSTFKLPRLAKGGIVNMPGRGVPVGGAISGERGQEGVIPLTDSQQMMLLGEAIGKYITINANITNTMNGRVISRELQRVQNDSDFAFNR